MSSIITAPSAVWEQVRLVRAQLGGRSWQQAFTGPVPLPSWLVDLVDGHMDAYVGPDPVLFRTSSIGLDWFTLLEEHPEQLEVTCAHELTPSETLYLAAQRLHDLGGTVDADVYVWGSGSAAGRFSARVHCLFGAFPLDTDLSDLLLNVSGLSDRFVVAVTTDLDAVLVRLTPSLRPWAVAA